MTSGHLEPARRGRGVTNFWDVSETGAGRMVLDQSQMARRPVVSGGKSVVPCAESPRFHRRDTGRLPAKGVLMTGLFEPVAIIGMAGRFPGAADTRQFWRNLREGREAVNFPSDEEFLAHGVTLQELADPSYVKAVSLAPGLDSFDAEFFGLTPRDAEICDPQLRLFLEIAHATFESAGYDPREIGHGVGVFGSTGPSRYADMYVTRSPRYRKEPINLWTLNNVDYLSTLVSFKFDLRGPSYTMATACSSSLVAIHLACQSLRLGECDVALAGGSTVNLPYSHGYYWAPGGVHSPDGHCRPFDAAGTGTIFGNGAAAVLLKRLPDALADGDHIHAVIRGTAINNDGADKVSFSAPSVTGQAAAIMEAMAVAGRLPEDISCVEAHGTGTALGDPVEVTALATAYRNLGGALPDPGSIPIGSVKSNVGHLVWAAGVTSLIKVVLGLAGDWLPANINFSSPNPRLELDRTPFTVNAAGRPWPRKEGRPRCAGISSLGIGGTNAHVVVEEGPARPVVSAPRRPRLVVWSGRDKAAAAAGRAGLSRYFAECGEEVFADAAATLQRGRAAHRVREAVVADNAAAAAELLVAGTVVSAAEEVTEPKDVTFLFPGQGAQHPAMAAGLYGTQPVFTETMDLCLELFERRGVALHEVWPHDGDADRLRDTGYAQPLLFCIEYALARTWTEWGVVPSAVLGHSIGEIVAATVAEVFTLEEAVALVAARGEAMAAMEPGAMLALALPENEVLDLLPAELSVATINPGPQTVIAGPVADVTELHDRLRDKGVAGRLLGTPHAFHTPAMRAAMPRFAEAFHDITPRAPRLSLYSGATGAPVSPEQVADPDFWVRQIAEPVRFAEAFAHVKDRPGLLLEVGPAQTLTRLARKDPDVRPRVVPSLGSPDSPRRDDERDLLSAVSALWTSGVPVDWQRFNEREGVRRVEVPGYPYRRRRFWVEPSTGPGAPRRPNGSLVSTPDDDSASGALTTAPDAATGAEEAMTPATPEAVTPFALLGWTEQRRPSVASLPRGERWALALVPDDRGAALSSVLPLQQAGYRTLRVRPGTGYTAVGEEYSVRPGQTADLRRLAEDLQATGRWPRLLVHAWGTQPWAAASPETVDEQLDLAFFGPLALLQELGRRPAAPPRVLVLTSRMVDVAGGEPVDPVKATTYGLFASLALETPGLDCRVIDLGSRVPEDGLVDEIAVADGPDLVALRGDRRWVRAEVPYEPDPAPPAVRRDGVYLITGGLGGLGLAVAKGLARTGTRPRLALLGRGGMPEPGHPRFETVRRAVEELESLGAQVKVLACDVADSRAVERALDVITARFGPLHGVLHLAGVAGDGMVQFRAREDAREVLRPKVLGTLTLERSLAGRAPLDFFVSFASRAGLRGMVGSADYAAANAFLDAWSVPGRPAARRCLSVDWPLWTTVGMGAKADRATVPVADAPGTAEDDEAELVHLAEMSAAGDWALDEHRFGGRAVLPGAGHVDLVMRAYRELHHEGKPVPLVLEEVVFQRVLVGDEPREVCVGLRPDGELYRFRVRSRPLDTDGPWTLHADGRVGAHSGGERRSVDVAALRATLPAVRPPSFVPTPQAFLALGPRWQGIDGMWAANGTKLVSVRLPEAFQADLSRHPAHPAMLDLATALVRDQGEDPPCLPFLYRRMLLHRDFPAHIHSRIRRRTGTKGVIVGDIDVIGPDGELVAEIEGFTMRVLKDLEFVGEAERAEHTPASDTVVSPDGLDPDTGVGLLLALLDARTLPQVVVRPYQDGQPVPPADAPAPAVSPPAPPMQLVHTAVPAPGLGATRAPEGLPSLDAAPAPAPHADGTFDTDDTVLPAVRAIWEEATGITELPETADFFDIGGDSLSAVQVITRIRERFGLELSIGLLFDHPTLGAVSALVGQQLEA
ncbi:type I polyketide synthase [Streptomyces sp. B4I13]|uniref:type I polyketide synthase n=1 Tax=Streptomyces sp. B4I13 TaxID=3042271 RepID=UPI0027D8528E|nr:type I polyketide synthase [Streptomyces sp. B4I13]